MIRSSLPVPALIAAAAVLSAQTPATQPASAPADIEAKHRLAANLPDWSDGYTGVLGPFLWARATDMGEDLRFSNADGTPNPNGEYLWFYQFARGKRQAGLTPLIHGRNNVVVHLPDLAFTVQPVKFLHNTTRPHNSKIVFGYVNNATLPYQHGDNGDLAHLGKGDRVVVFFPVRREGKDALDQNGYLVNQHYGAQTPCVIEFKAGEMIHYEWFRDPKNLDAHILFDLQPYFSGDNAMKPGVSQPILKFDITPGGGWKLRIKRDGKTPIADLTDDKSFDHVFTHESQGAKKYTVDLSKNAFALSVFSPGGSPLDSSELVIGLKPYSRTSHKAVEWPARSTRIREVKVDKLDAAINSAKP